MRNKIDNLRTQPIPKLMSLHQVVWHKTNPKVIYLRYLSCFLCCKECNHHPHKNQVFAVGHGKELSYKNSPPSTVAKHFLKDAKEIKRSSWAAVIFDASWYPGYIREELGYGEIKHEGHSSLDGRSLYGGTPGTSSPDLAEGAPILFVNEGVDSDGQLVTEFEPVSMFHPEALRRRLERDLPNSETDMQPASEERNSEVHVCRECKEPFSTEEEMINHLKTHYSCIDCGQTFTEVDELTEHCKMLCAAEPWCCKTCGMTFSSKDKLHSHLQVHTEKPYICDECPSSFSRKDVLARHKAIHAGRQFMHVCDECSRVFTREEDLNLHKQTHSFCKDCGVLFASSQELSTHKLSCPNIKPWPCDLCDKSFVSKDRLNRHLKIHSTDKPYVCEICSAAFNRRDKLTRHKTTHSGDRPYQCEYCDLSFTRRDKLGRHMTTHFKSQVNNEENYS